MINELEIKDFNDNLVLTTKDNPFNPKTEYLNWKTWDESHGYYTEAYVARVANVPLDADIEDDIIMDQYIIKAHQDILDNDFKEIYLLV